MSHRWLADTGATNHATPELSLLSSSKGYHGDDTLCV